MTQNDAIQKVIEGFEKGYFIRDISREYEPGWALEVIPYIGALAFLQKNNLDVQASLAILSSRDDNKREGVWRRLKDENEAIMADKYDGIREAIANLRPDQEIVGLSAKSVSALIDENVRFRALLLAVLDLHGREFLPALQNIIRHLLETTK